MTKPMDRRVGRDALLVWLSEKRLRRRGCRMEWQSLPGRIGSRRTGGPLEIIGSIIWQPELESLRQRDAYRTNMGLQFLGKPTHNPLVLIDIGRNGDTGASLDQNGLAPFPEFARTHWKQSQAMLACLHFLDPSDPHAPQFSLSFSVDKRRGGPGAHRRG